MRFTSAMGLVCCVLLAGCSAADSAAAQRDPASAAGLLLSGEPYVGTLRVQVAGPGDAFSRSRGEGRASVREVGGGLLELSIEGSVDGQPVAGFVAAGRADGGGWSGDAGGLNIMIAPDGGISGQGRSAQGPATVSGQVYTAQMEFRVEIEVDAAAAGAGRQPEGAKIELLYMLMPENDSAPGKDPDDGDCDVKYRTKLVPNIGGAGMNSVRVPYCD